MDFIKRFLGIAFLILTINLAAQTNYTKLKAKYSVKIPELLKKNKVQGASIALIDGDSVVWKQGFGFADEEKQIVAKPETLYKIGSVSKLLTGSAVMQLQEQGKLNIDYPVTNYIKDLKMRNRFDQNYNFTIRQVLTHHAGIPSDVMKSFFSYEPEDYGTIVNYLNEEYLTFPPDYVHSYSNPGFSLMGILVERVSGEEYPEYMREHIFKPLRMENTCFWGIDKDVEAMSKTYDSKGKELNAPKLRDVPAGGIWSNVLELSNFLMEMIPENNQNEILQETTKNKIFEVQNRNVPFDVNNPIGIVWEIGENTKAGTIYEHGGATMAHRAMVAVAPETGLGVVILTNSVQGGAIIGLYRQILEEAAEIKEVAKELKKQNENTDLETCKLANDEFNDYEGVYIAPGVIIDIKKKHGNLQTRLQGIKLQFLNLHDNEFIAKVKLLGFIGIKLKSQRFYFDEINGEKIMIQGSINSNSKIIAGQKVEVKEIPEVWQARLGRYELLNKDDFEFVKTCELKEQKGLLVLSIGAKLEKVETMDFALGIENDELAYILGIGRHGGQAVRVLKGDDNSEILYYSGYKFKKMLE